MSEKFKILNEYAKEWGFKDWGDLISNVIVSIVPINGITNHCLNVANKIQEAQQERIFGNLSKEFSSDLDPINFESVKSKENLIN